MKAAPTEGNPTPVRLVQCAEAQEKNRNCVPVRIETKTVPAWTECKEHEGKEMRL